VGRHQYYRDSKKAGKDSGGNWAFGNSSFYFPTPGAGLSDKSAQDPNKFHATPVLAWMPAVQFNKRIPRCPCPKGGFGYTHVISHGYTDPFRVVGADVTYAAFGMQYLCKDCRDKKKRVTMSLITHLIAMTKMC
jgi:hypothetical protein